jgi:hypothetical protein
MIADIFNAAIGVSFERLLYVFIFFDFHIRLLGVLSAGRFGEIEYHPVNHRSVCPHENFYLPQEWV